MNARQLILRILTQVDRQPGCMERIVDETLDYARLDHRDKRFVFEAVYGIVRRKLTLDHIIEPLLATAGLKKNATLRRILRMGVYQIVYMDRVPDHAAVNESVNLAKNDSETRAVSGVVNGVLRRIVADRTTIMPDLSGAELSERLSIEYSHPRWMIERWLGHFGLARTKQLLVFNNERPGTWLRRKIRNISRPQFETEIRTIGEQATGYRNLYYRLKKNVIPETLWVLRDGLCTVQAPSSGWVVGLMEAAKGDKVLDVCSSPGGKTALLSDIVGDEGAVCAGDDRWNRIALTLETVRRMKLGNVYPVVCDGGKPPFNGVFDKVLIDAPCSATGVLNRHPEARWTRMPGDISKLSEMQKQLLEAAAYLIGRGGTLVYATCSLEPEENAGQIRRFLTDHPEFEHAGCGDAVPQTYIDSDGFMSITPFDHHMDGMFAARLRKRNSR
ncbi:MAG: 16S rRNA (cytosine(967)-C(5))-methyltransferase RsmB [Chitinispirillaceae bacterium]|nr:16S rRNA (cytosine(967)-C(5))-methyltransferase RsmB [Chitinispirillaceae bacterium]